MSDFSYEITDGAAEQKRARLSLPEELTIVHAQVLRQTLAAALDECGELDLDGSAVNEVDLAAMQLLCALHRAAVFRGKTVVLRGKDSGCWPETLALAGFCRHEGCMHATDKTTCLWCS
jgi:ABC-type transporter Mla MlaB component